MIVPLPPEYAELMKTKGVSTSPLDAPPWLPASLIPWSPQRTSNEGREFSSSCQNDQREQKLKKSQVQEHY